MNQYKSNHEFYQSVFNEIHASDELMMKVQNMTENKTNKKIYAIRKVALVAAAIMMMLVISNAVVYATTGATWVEKLITVNVDGEEKEASVINKYDENGKLDSQEIVVDHGNGRKDVFEIDGQDAEEDPGDFGIITDKSIAMPEPSVVKENDKVFLDWSCVGVREDITEDFSDGKAEFTAKDDDNVEMKFTITGTVDKYKIVVSSEGDTYEVESD